MARTRRQPTGRRPATARPLVATSCGRRRTACTRSRSATAASLSSRCRVLRNTTVIFVALPCPVRSDESSGHLAAGGLLLYLLRVSVPDRPGALGLLAGAIGSAGGDITAVDVVEREASSAIDDILIETA